MAELTWLEDSVYDFIYYLCCSTTDIIIIITIPVSKPEAYPDKLKCDVVTVTWALFVLRGLCCQFIFRLNGQHVHSFVSLRNFKDSQKVCVRYKNITWTLSLV